MTSVPPENGERCTVPDSQFTSLTYNFSSERHKKRRRACLCGLEQEGVKIRTILDLHDHTRSARSELASDIVSLREAIWRLLSDQNRFANL
jgi:hypothetical protein